MEDTKRSEEVGWGFDQLLIFPRGPAAFAGSNLVPGEPSPLEMHGPCQSSGPPRVTPLKQPYNSAAHLHSEVIHHKVHSHRQSSLQLRASGFYNSAQFILLNVLCCCSTSVHEQNSICSNTLTDESSSVMSHEAVSAGDEGFLLHSLIQGRLNHRFF